MSQITALVLTDGLTASVTYDPLRNDGSGTSSFRDNSKGQDNLKNLIHLNSSTNSSGTRKGRLDFIHRKVKTVDGEAMVSSTANVSILVSVPSNYSADEKKELIALAQAAFKHSMIVGVLRDGDVLF